MSHPDPTYEEVLICDKCGDYAYMKLIGNEVYDWCDNCGCVEECTTIESIEA